mgnify:CR=1
MSLKAFNHGKGQIDLTHLPPGSEQMKPVELHLKEDGSKTNEPSFAIVLTRTFSRPVYGEVSLKMLNEALGELGYKITKQ